MTWFKFLGPGAAAPFSGFRWPSPGPGHDPGDWVQVTGPVEVCRNGLHVCRRRDLPFWLQEELYVVDLDGPVVEHARLVVARRGRLRHRVDGWGRAGASRFSAECAWRVRDLTRTALVRAGRRSDADDLDACSSIEGVTTTAARILEESGDLDAWLLGYTTDAAHFAGAVGSGPGWAASAASTALIAATAAGAAVGAAAAPSAMAAERRRQAASIAALVPA